MDEYTFSRAITRAAAQTAAALDTANDMIPVVDVSETAGKAKFKSMTPAAFAQALQRIAGQSLNIPLVSGTTATGLKLTATPGAGVFGVSLTPGTSTALTGETAQSNTKTDLVCFEVQLPANYVDGDAVSLVVNATMTGTATVKSVDASAYEVSTAGVHSADLVTTNVQTITTSAADYTFVITPTALVAGDRLLVQLTTVTTEAAAATAIPTINSVRLTF